MNPTIPYKKHLLSVRKQRQSILRRQKMQSHGKSNSGVDFLQIKGNQRQNQFSQRTIKESENEKHQAVQEMVERQFIALKQKVQSYCKQFNQTFVQHQKIENTLQQKGQWVADSVITEDKLFNLLIGRIRQFMKESGFEDSYQCSPKKLDFLNSNSNSFNVQSIISLTGDTEELQKIENVEVLEIYNNFRNNKIIGECKSPSSESNKQLLASDYSSNFINSLPIACSSTVSQILYKEARLRTFPEFHTFCQKVLLEKKPVIADFHFFKRQKLEKTNFYLGEIYRKLNLLNTRLSFVATGEMNLVKRENFLLNEERDKGKNIGRQIDEICIVLKKLNQLHNLNSVIFDCTRPCCKAQQTFQTTSTKAKILLNLKQSAKKSLHYNTQVTDEYFNRYYNKQSFDRTRIYSLSKTKTQQMEKLQKTYHRMKDNKKACRKRCHSLFENII